jgi:hypothetical protein
VSGSRRAPRAAVRLRGADAPSVALAATLHDPPPGALAAEIARHLPALGRYYAGVAVATSPPTAARINDALRAAGVYAGTPAGNVRGPLYRLALRRALATGATRIHYLDFDRALHWVATRPGELGRLLRTAPRRRVLLVGRTRAAHRTHHLPLAATEAVANRWFARALGLRGRIDFLVPSFVLDRAATAALLARSRARDAAIYGEWTALVCELDRTLAYVECRGLDWETPDRDRRAVARLGLAAWREGWNTPEEWTRRLAMADAFIRAFRRARARRPRRVRLVRLRLR